MARIRITQVAMATAAIIISATASADATFFASAPPCKVASKASVPTSYKRFGWTQNVGPDDLSISGGGEKKFEGVAAKESSYGQLQYWFNLYRVDVDGDGSCDWISVVNSPVSTGGRRIYGHSGLLVEVR